MYCAKCKESVEELGGTQMNGCYHFLCTQCIVDTVKAVDTPKIPCAGYKGVYRCTGFLEQEEIECMVPDKVFRKYCERVNAAEERNENGDDVDEDDEENADESVRQAEVAFANLDLTEEEKSCGWAHKVAWIDDLVRNEGYTFEEAHAHLDMLPILENRSVITCSICLEDIQAGNGVVLKDCLHIFCKECLGGHIRACETATVECPNPDCDEPLKYGEIAALVDGEEVNRHFVQLSLKEAAASMQGVAHCLTPNCYGFVVAEQGVNEFRCQVCRANNCIACKVIHPGTCAEFKQRLADDQNRQKQRQNDQLSEDAIRQNLNQRVFVNCPKCNVVIEKNGGCPNMVCGNRGCGHQFVWGGVPA